MVEYHVGLFKAGNYYKVMVTGSTKRRVINKIGYGNPYKIIEIIWEPIDDKSIGKEMINIIRNEYRKYRKMSDWFLLDKNQASSLARDMLGFIAHKKIQKEAMGK